MSLMLSYRNYNVFSYVFILCALIYIKIIIEVNKNIFSIKDILNIDKKDNTNNVIIKDHIINTDSSPLASLDNSYIIKKNYNITYLKSLKNQKFNNYDEWSSYCKNLLLNDPLLEYIPDIKTNACIITTKDYDHSNNNLQCDTLISDIILTPANEYSCVSKYPSILGGLGSIEIQVCSGELYDLKTNILHKNFFDISQCPNFNGFDEILKEENTYRFMCPSEKNKDLLGNPLIPISSIIDSSTIDNANFVNVRNRCTSMLYNANNRYNQLINKTDQSLTCQCEKYSDGKLKNFKNILHNPCTTCIHRWAGADERIIKSAKYGLTIARPCINQGTFPDLFKDIIFPCGLRSTISKTSCEEAVLQATNNLSPIAISNILVTT